MLNTTAIKQLIDSAAAPGVSITSIAGGKTHSYNYGTWSDTDLRPVDEHTVYDLASLTKLYTTALVMRLYEAGKLELDAPCSRYLENFSDSELTIQDLLTHRAHFQVRISEAVREGKGSLDAIPIPRKRCSYTEYQNAPFLFLGRIVEYVTSSPIAESFRTLLHGLGLMETYTGDDIIFPTPPTEIRDGEVWQGKTHDESACLLGGIAGHAGLFASSSDVAKFAQAWQDGRIVSPETAGLIFRNYAGDGDEQRQGLGWFNRMPYVQDLPRSLFCHTGFTGTCVIINRASGNVYAITSNRTYYGRLDKRYRLLFLLAAQDEIPDFERIYTAAEKNLI